MESKILITGGCGFIGSNLANYLLQNQKCEKVTVLDNLLRKGSKKNLDWLQKTYDDKLEFIFGDVRDYELVRKTVKNKEIIYHLAAQVAVTSSVSNPREDFEINTLGTLNILEAARLSGTNPIIIFASTNKVYGEMKDIPVKDTGNRYTFKDLPDGISEERCLDFHSPYGCSKGAADQYVRDYSRIYGLRTVVFRMSCIYGTRQFGNEDQGWVAHFVISAVLKRPITIYGDGKQVRDVLFVDDLIKGYQLAIEKIDSVKGEIFNIGGGPKQTLSLLELIDWLEKKTGRAIEHRFAAWRPGDQEVYISNIAKAKRLLGWQPTITVSEGVERLYQWVVDNLDLFD